MILYVDGLLLIIVDIDNSRIRGVLKIIITIIDTLALAKIIRNGNDGLA